VQPLTFDDVLHWDSGAIHQAFQVANKRARTLHTLGENLAAVQKRALEHWGGEAGQAFQDDMEKARQDIEADGRESERVAAAVTGAEEDVSKCRAEAKRLQGVANANLWTITPGWAIETGDSEVGRDPVEFAAQLQILRDDLDKLQADAEQTDHELATAVHAAVGEAQLDPTSHPTTPAPQQTPDTVPGPHNGDPGYKTGLSPTLAGSAGDHPPMHVGAGSSDQVQLQDNPPGYNGPAGPQRDAAWQAYLSHQNGATTGKVDPKTWYYPTPMQCLIRA
jgi:uncharacterized protein YukE